jgi:hypothetical protein
MFEVNLQEADLNYKRKQKLIVAKNAGYYVLPTLDWMISAKFLDVFK